MPKIKDSESPTWLEIVAFPDFISCVGLVASLAAVYFALKDAFNVAFLLIFISGICDVADGITARLLQKSRPFGLYLDCFVDTIAFLAVVSIVTYLLGVKNLFIHIVYITSGCLRHARLLAYPKMKPLGIGSTIGGLVVPFVFFLHQWFKFDLLLTLSIFMMALSLGMLARFDTKYRSPLS
jgi:phosphatidylserine synthase